VEGQADPQHRSGHAGRLRYGGHPKSEAIEATATVLDKAQTGLVYDAVGREYGLIGRVFNLFSKLRGGMQKNVGLELRAAS